MTSKAQRLAALDRDFDSLENQMSGALKLDVYLARRKLIEAETDPAPIPAPAPRPVGLSERQLVALARGLGVAIREHFKAKLEPLETRLNSLADATRVAELTSRVAELERRLDDGQKRSAELHVLR